MRGVLIPGESIELPKAAEAFTGLHVRYRVCSMCGQLYSFGVRFSGYCVMCSALSARQSHACPCHSLLVLVL